MINELIHELNRLSQLKLEHFKPAEVIPLIDLTHLKEQTQWADIYRLCEKANQYPIASVCLFPEHIKQAKQVVNRVGTVINFPYGNNSLEKSLEEIHACIQLGADEIDAVFNYREYLEGNRESALTHIAECYALCQQHSVCFKVILETGALNTIEMIHQASLDVIEAGCDFLKTSTGKTEVGASLDAGFAMLKAIKAKPEKKVGIKYSGGINSSFQAMQYVHLTKNVLEIEHLSPEQIRFGASRLLDELIESH